MADTETPANDETIDQGDGPNGSGEELVEPTTEGESEEKPKHPIATAINTALHRYRDIEAVAKLMVPLAGRIQREMWESSQKVLSDAESKFDESDPDGEIDDVLAAQLDEAFLALDRLSEANLPRTMLTSLFLGLFSAFDAFTGNLLQAIYKKRPELLEALNIEIPLSELLTYESFEDLKDSLLFDEIEKLRRKSYVEQFKSLETRFGLNLRKFESWSSFVEFGQRRNLITHCEGIVSKQYLKICEENDVEFPEALKEGDRLSISLPYLQSACSIVYEVTVKLGQTLWRKLFADESDSANEHLTEPIYESLQIERWDRAILLSEFAASLQDDVSDLDRRIRTVNFAIALRFSERGDDCKELLDREDWSAALPDFKLAIAVLNDDFEKASKIMMDIGEKGELVSQKSYHAWPLFREFRRSEHFLNSYEAIYKTSYASELAEIATRADEKEKATKHEGNSDTDDPLEGKNLPFEAVKHIIG